MTCVGKRAREIVANFAGDLSELLRASTIDKGKLTARWEDFQRQVDGVIHDAEQEYRKSVDYANDRIATLRREVEELETTLDECRNRDAVDFDALRQLLVDGDVPFDVEVKLVRSGLGHELDQFRHRAGRELAFPGKGT